MGSLVFINITHVTKWISGALLSAVCFLGFNSIAAASDCTISSLPIPNTSYSQILGTSIQLLEVTGRTSAVTNKKRFKGPAIGLKARVIESVNHSAESGSEMELFLFGTQKGCFDFAGVDWKPQKGTRLLVFGKNKQHHFLPGKYELDSTYEFGFFDWTPKFRIIDAGFKLTALKEFSYQDKDIGNFLANVALVLDAEKLSVLKRNSRARKKILKRLFQMKSINFPTFVDPTCPSYPMCGLRPGVKGQKSMFWLKKWERRLIEDWNKHKSKKTAKIVGEKDKESVKRN